MELQPQRIAYQRRDTSAAIKPALEEANSQNLSTHTLESLLPNQ